MKEKDTIDWILLKKKIEGTLSASEKEEVERWLQGNTKRQEFFKHAEKYYSTNDISIPDEKKIVSSWERLKPSLRMERAIRYWLKWSVAAACILILGLSLLWKSMNSELEKTVITEILPGTHKACLILSDGSVIDLGKEKPEAITEQCATILIDNGRIAYERKGTEEKVKNNTIQVPLGGEFHLTLSDSTQVWLNSGTTLTYPVAFSGNERKVILSGEAYFEVKKNEKQPFIVKAGNIGIQVLGTSFNVHAYEEESAIQTTLVGGKIQLWANNQAMCILHPNEQAVWDNVKNTMEVKKVNTAYYTKWKEGFFVFRDNNLEEIMTTLSRWYTIEYEFTDASLRKEKFYGTIGRYEHITDLLRQFEKTGKVRFEYQGKKIIILK